MILPVESDSKTKSLTAPAPWLRVTPFALISSFSIITYILLGNFFPSGRVVVDYILTPVVDGLGLFYLNIRSPFIVGALEYDYYRNLTGLCLIFSVLYNLASVIYIFKTGKSAAISCEEAHRRMVILRGVSSRRAWLTLHAATYFIAGGIALFTTFSFFNGIFGWLVFSLGEHGILLTLIVCLGFLLPSAISVALWSAVIQYVLFDARKIIEAIMAKKEV